MFERHFCGKEVFMKRMDFRIAFFGLAMLLASCSGSGLGCGGCASTCGGDPNYKFQGTPLANGIRTRITQQGFDFIAQNLKPIIEAVLAKAGQQLDCSGTGITVPDQIHSESPQGSTVKPNGNNCTTTVNGLSMACTGPLPASGSFWYYFALKGNNFCGRLETNSLKITLNESDNSVTLGFSIPEIQVRSQNPELGVCGIYRNVPVVGGTACGYVDTKLTNVELKLTNLTGSIKFQFVSDPATGKVGMKVAPNGINIGGTTRFTMKAGCQNLTIGLIKLLGQEVKIDLGSGFCNTIVGAIAGIINNTQFIQPLIFRALNGVIENQVKQFDLLAEAKAEMQIPLAPIVGGFGIPGLDRATPLGLLMRPGTQLGVVSGGLNLGMDTGFEASPNNKCVPLRPEPQDKPSATPALNGQYHLAASLSKAATNRMMWAVYQTGLLCIRVNSSDVHKLSGGAFPLNAGIFSLLAPNLTKLVPQDAPVMLELQPTQAPKVQFGTGQQVGGKTDSTLQLYVPDMGISLSVLLHDRFVRLFRLVVDMDLGLSLIATPNNSLEAAFDTDRLNLQNARVEQANLVDASDINSLLPTLLTLITQVLGTNKISFPIDISDSISKALGVPITINIDGITRDGVGKDWLTLALTMKYSGSVPLLPRPMTTAQLDTQNPGWTKTINGKLTPTGEVRLFVPQYLGPHELEYQYFVDYGAWSGFHTAPDGVLTVRNRFLNLLGKHTVYLRARLKGEYRSLEEEPVKVEFTFDPVAPQLKLTQKDGVLRVTGNDAVSSREELRYEAKINGQWQEITGGTLPLKELQQPTLQVRVTDAQGNTRQVKWSTTQQSLTDERTSTAPQQGPTQAPAFGCHVAPQQAPQLPFWMLLLLVVPFFRRRLR